MTLEETVSVWRFRTANRELTCDKDRWRFVVAPVGDKCVDDGSLEDNIASLSKLLASSMSAIRHTRLAQQAKQGLA